MPIRCTFLSGLISAWVIAATPAFGQQIQPEDSTGRTDNRLVIANRHMVAAAHPDAVAAGLEMLRRGGSAADAAIAVQLVLNLVEALSDVDVGDIGAPRATTDETPMGTTAEQQLLNYVSSILKKIASSSKGASGPGFWKTYARYYAITGAPGSEAECLTKHIRGLSTSTWHAQDDLFQEYVESCIALARTNLALPDVSKAALSQSRMLLRSALQRSKENYGTAALFLAMEQALEDVSSRLDQL